MMLEDPPGNSTKVVSPCFVRCVQVIGQVCSGLRLRGGTTSLEITGGPEPYFSHLLLPVTSVHTGDTFGRFDRGDSALLREVCSAFEFSVRALIFGVQGFRFRWRQQKVANGDKRQGGGSALLREVC